MYYAYLRVSTRKQGISGVSLQEQRAAINQYAENNQLFIGAWFEERETAATEGRSVFTEMVRSVADGSAEGLIMHKIDRGARNLGDWVELGRLIDQGVEVRFAGEGLDLRTRGGRLSADIQAVVAADYVRNLREETRKGFYGRLKQGLYPLPAPLGYLDNGTGKVKTLDPIRAPLIREAFRLFVVHDYTLTELRERLGHLELRNRVGHLISITSLSNILRNPFYTGRIRLKNSGVFSGRHEPLISRALFDEVGRILNARRRRAQQQRAFAFSRMIVCACGRSLVAETHKGHVYYRCHTKGCASIREERIDEVIFREFQSHPQSALLTLAFRQASPCQRRMLATCLKLEMQVRGLVRVRNGIMEISCKILNPSISQELSRVLQEILLCHFQKTKD